MLKNKIHIILVLLFSITYLASFAQLDSLELELKIKEGDEKFELLLDISKEYWYVDALKSVNYAKEAFEQAKTNNLSVIDEIGYSIEWYKDGARIE